MVNMLEMFVLCIAFGPHLTVTEFGQYASNIDCVHQSSTSGSSWACGYCLRTETNGNQRIVRALRMDSKTECDKWREKGECLYAI